MHESTTLPYYHSNSPITKWNNCPTITPKASIGNLRSHIGIDGVPQIVCTAKKWLPSSSTQKREIMATIAIDYQNCGLDILSGWIHPRVLQPLSSRHIRTSGSHHQNSVHQPLPLPQPTLSRAHVYPPTHREVVSLRWRMVPGSPLQAPRRMTSMSPRNKWSTTSCPGHLSAWERSPGCAGAQLGNRQG